MSYSYIVNVSMVKVESVSKNDDQNWSRKSYFEIQSYGKSMCTMSLNL